MPSSCAVAHCEHKYTQSTNVSFHKFPVHKPYLLQEWINFADRDAAWQPSRWSSICSRHFLSSDFRDHSFRKYLKPLAVPTVTIRKLKLNATDLDMNDNCHYANNGNEDPADRSYDQQQCRLCARIESVDGTSSSSVCSIEDPPTAASIAKCLPNVRFDSSHQFPKKVCAECSAKVQQFALFADLVTGVQTYFLQKPFRSLGEDPSSQSRSNGISFSNSVVATSKPLVIIKQEPIVKVKQEVVDTIRTGSIAHECNAAVAPMDLFPENDAFCEFCDVYFINNFELKNHIVNFHSDDSREVPNNCEIMEIITLENAFVNLADNCVDDDYDNRQQIMEHHQSEPTADLHGSANEYVPLERVMKVEHLNDYEHREQLRIITAIKTEHNYAHSLSNGVFMSVHESGLKQELTAPILQPTDTSFKVFESCTSGDDHEAYESKTVVAALSQQHTRTCTVCGHECKSVYHYLVHKNGHRTKNVQRSKRKCYVCNAKFHSKVALENHKHCHIGGKLSLTCGHCQMVFRKSVQLRIHAKRCRTKTKSCDAVIEPLPAIQVDPPKASRGRQRKCYAKTATSDPAVLQLENGRYACDQCNRSYGRRSNLYRHQSFHRPRDQWTHKCPGCNVMFDREYDLRLHIRHHDCTFVPDDDNDDNSSTLVVGSVKAFVCPVCGVQYKTAQKLRNHELVHSGAKPFVCEECGKRFRFRNNLYQHKLTHLNDRKHKCSLCAKVFKRLAGLNQHVRGFHYKIKPHECPVCKYSYALKGDMTRCKHSILKMQSN